MRDESQERMKGDRDGEPRKKPELNASLFNTYGFGARIPKSLCIFFSPSLCFTEASEVSLRKSRDEVILDQSEMESFQTGDKWWLPGKDFTLVGQLGRELRLKSTSHCEKQTKQTA